MVKEGSLLPPKVVTNKHSRCPPRGWRHLPGKSPPRGTGGSKKRQSVRTEGSCGRDTMAWSWPLRLQGGRQAFQRNRERPRNKAEHGEQTKNVPAHGLVEDGRAAGRERAGGTRGQRRCEDRPQPRAPVLGLREEPEGEEGREQALWTFPG